MRKKIGYRYWNKVDNTGDAIMAYVLDEVLDVEPIVSSRHASHLLGIGSILFMANRQSEIWGSGALNEAIKTPNLNPKKVHAVRGPKTLALLRDRGLKIADVPFGDPGLLVNRLKLSNAEHPKYRVCFILHHSFEKRKAEVEEFYKKYNSVEVCFVSMLDSTSCPLIMIKNSEVVVSQGLHGLIFAEAFGKPSLWISDKNDANWKFKFQDWLATTDRKYEEPFAMGNLPGIEEISRLATRKNSLVDETALINAFPSNLELDSHIEKHFIECRASSPYVINFPLHEFLKSISSATSEKKIELQRKFLMDLKSRFSNWAEPPYTLLWASEMAPSVEMLGMVKSYMNMNSDVNHLYIDQSVSKKGEFIKNAMNMHSEPLMGMLVRPTLEWDAVANSSALYWC